MENNTEIRKILTVSGREILAELCYKQLTSGHINQTYLVHNNGEQLIFQKLNPQVFPNLNVISENILNLGNHLKEKQYPHEILEQIPFENGEYLYESQWRIFKYIKDSQTFLNVQSSTQAYEAAKFLGSFHKHLTDFPLNKIVESIKGFLDFESRFQQYQAAIRNTDTFRLKKAKDAIEYLNKNHTILREWLILLPQLPTRIIHGDPKISNFLFDKSDSNKILALIDWDTLMPGTILYDFGDMVRSYTNLKEEDDPESGNNFSLENYRALERGFLFHLEEKLTPLEIKYLYLGAKIVIYIQALRFLTDYLNGDIYYATQRPEQNLDRTKNQINLLQNLKLQV